MENSKAMIEAHFITGLHHKKTKASREGAKVRAG